MLTTALFRLVIRGLAQCLLVKAPETETRCDGEGSALHALGGPETQIFEAVGRWVHVSINIDYGIKTNVDASHLVS